MTPRCFGRQPRPLAYIAVLVVVGTLGCNSDDATEAPPTAPARPDVTLVDVATSILEGRHEPDARASRATADVADPAGAGPVARAPTQSARLITNPFADAVGEWVGGDVPRIYPLPDGRQLWWLHDSFLPADGRAPVDQFKFVRNVAFLRDLDGSLEMLAGGQPGARQEFLPHPNPDRFTRFFWPLGGEVDGELLKVFMAEMECLRPNWGICFSPVGTHLATFRWADMSLISVDTAADSGVRPIYGFSVASDDEWSYLFGNGYEYNTPDEFGGSDQMFVARVPRGKLEQQPRYWDGSMWNPDPVRAVPLVERGYADFRMSVVRWKDRWIGVAKEDEFVGRRIIVMEADRPEGPWRDLAWIPLEPPDTVIEGVTYDAIPYPEPIDGKLAIFYSVNSKVESVVFNDPSVYRPVLLLTDIE